LSKPTIEQLQRECSRCGRGKAITERGGCNYCLRTFNYWDSHSKPITVTHIHHTARNTPTSVIEPLKVGIGYFLRRYPQYQTKLDTYTLARNWMNCGVYMIQGTIQGGDQFITYLLYLLYQDWEYMRVLRSPRKRRIAIGKVLKDFTFQHNGKSYNLFNLLVKQSYKHYNSLQSRGVLPLPVQYDGRFKPPVLGYVSEEEAVAKANGEEYCFNTYSFDK